MQGPRRTLLTRYGVAVVSVALAVGIRWLLEPVLGDRVPFATFFVAVVFTAWYGGLGPGLLSVALGAVAAIRFFIPPADAFLVRDLGDAVSLALFLFMGTAVALISGAVQSAQRRLEAHARDADRTRKWFETTLASIGDAVIVTDAGSRVTFLNAVAEGLTGWPAAEAQGQPLERVFPILNERSRQPAENPAHRVLREGGIVELANHTILIARDGTERAIDDSAAPIRGEDGQILGVVLVFRDVTDRRRLERERRRLAALVEHSEDAIIGQTPDGTITDWNAAAERLFGYTAAEAVGQSLGSLLVPPERSQELTELHKRVLGGEAVTDVETERVGKDGRRIHVSLRVSAIRDSDDHIVGLSAIDRDRSTRRNAERRRAARLAVTHVLAHEESISQAAWRILEAISEALEWDFGALWKLERDEQRLRCVETWRNPSSDVGEFQETTRRITFGPGEGLPGRIWASGQPAWIADVVRDSNFPRSSVAETAGIHGAFGFPVTVGDEFLGVLEFFSHEIREPDADLLEMMNTIGGQIGLFVDRTEAEKRLREREQELSDFFENAAVGLHWVGPDGTILRANKAELELLGYSREEYVGHHVADFHVDQAVIQAMLERLGRGETLHNYEARLRCRDGSIKHVLIDSNVLWEDGRFVHSRCFTRDVTEQKRSEQALRDSQERLRLALVAGGMGTWEWNIQTGSVVWSPGLELIHGLEPGGFNGTFEAFQRDIHPDDRDAVLTSIRETVESGREHRIEYRIIRRDGELRWVEGRGRLFRDPAGRPERMIGVCSDMTARHRAEQASRFLADASASLAMLVDPQSTLQRIAHLAIPEFADWCAVDILSADGELQCLAVAHADPAKVALAERLYQQYPPDPRVPYGRRQVLRTRRSEFLSEIAPEQIASVARDDEHRRLLLELGLRSYICVPLLLRQEILGVLTFASAESGRRYGPDDVAVAEDLARRAAIAIENAQLYQELREADRRKDEFLAMLGHELRNPLAPLRTGLDVLSLGDGNPAQSEVVTLMKRQVEHLVRLVDDLLDVSRFMRGKVDLRLEPVELSAVVQAAVATVRPSVVTRGQQLDVLLPKEPVWLNADAVRLTQVLDNLLNNASKYTDRGGRIELSASVEPETPAALRSDGNGDSSGSGIGVRPSVSAPDAATRSADGQIPSRGNAGTGGGGGDLVIRVSDNGMGIEPELLPRIFDLFTQSPRGSDRSQGGLGVGLTLVKSLVEMHGGSVTAHSAGLGQGSRFTIRLPTCAAAELAGAEPPVPSRAAGRRVLVVDDNVGATRMLSVLLEKLGPHEVEVAHDGAAALEKACQFRPDLVLLDIGLPGMDGFEVAGKLRERDDLRDTLLVALTGYGQEKDRRKSMQAGFDEHVVKPPSVDLLQRLLSHPKLDSR